MKQHPPGLLAMSCSENARYSMCWASVGAVQRPAGSIAYTAASLSIAENWNHVVKNVLLPRPELEWIFLMNDDHVYQPDTLIRLLDHELDAVSALYCERVMPYGPVAYDSVDENGWLTRLSLAAAGYDTAQPVPIVACGDGAFLVRRTAFELVDPPWWSFGELSPDRADHDVSFCRRLRDAGIPIHVDLTTIVDHVTPMALAPERQPDGSWLVKIRDRQRNSIEIQTSPSLEGVA